MTAHPLWQGNPRQYQLRAQDAYATHHDRVILPWSWITTDCGETACLNPECMTVHQPRTIAYPLGVCVYCGNPGGTKDHLLPEPSTGATLRRLVAVVPACGDCNNRIGDHPSANVAERRRVAQLSIERTSKRLLLSPHKTTADLLELGPLLRTVAVKNNKRRALIKLRLSWPDDPFYDLRAFQKSGIDDPAAMGLCDAIATPLRPEYAEMHEESA